MKNARIHIDQNKVNINVESPDLGPQIAGAFLKAKPFRDLFISVLNGILGNGGNFEPQANSQIQTMLASPDHQVSQSLFNYIIAALPHNKLRISPAISIAYNLVQNEPIISNNRITAYVAGTISGMQSKIENANYTTQGALDINIYDSHQFEMQISASVFNEALEVLLGK